MINPSGRKGVILITAVGILAVMSLIATSFALNMQLEQKMAVNYLNRVRAEAVAEAGLNKAIAEIRKRAKEEPYSDLISGISASYPSNNSTETEIDDSVSCVIRVQDESQKVNINTFTQTDASEISALHSHGLSYDQIAKIIDYRDADNSKTLKLYPSGGGVVCQGSEVNAKNSFFATTEEIKLIDGISKEDFEKVKEDITVNKPIIRGGLLARYYKPVAIPFTYSQDDYLGTVVELGELRKLDKDKDMEGAESDEESQDAEFAGGYLMNKKTGNDWRLDQFGVIYEGYIYVLPEELIGISFSLSSDDRARMFIDAEEVSGSFVFKYAGWHPLRIEYYDLGGDNYIELKWKGGEYVPAERLGYDPPTETDYNSAGIYKIISTGKVKSKDGGILAEKTVCAVVSIFGVWTQTARSEFSAAWAGEFDNCSDGEIKWVTWLDSCPTDEDEWNTNKMQWDKDWDPVTEAGDYETISDSLKLGYWDNFDEDVAYSVVNMTNCDTRHATSDATYGSFYDAGAGGVTLEKTDGDQELVLSTIPGSEDPLNISTSTVIREVNRNYYSTSDEPDFDIFARVWERDWGFNPGGPLGDSHELMEGWGYRPSQRNANIEDAPWWPEDWQCVGMLAVKFVSENEPYAVFFADAYDDKMPDENYGSPYDFFQLYLNWFWRPYIYLEKANLQSKVLAFIGEDTRYAAYLFGVGYNGISVFGDGSSNDMVYIQLEAQNHGTWYGGKQTDPIPDPNPPVETPGTYSESQTHFDSLRAIPESGYLVSTPFFAGDEVEWGTISWNDNPTSKIGVKIYLRSASGEVRDSANSAYLSGSDDFSYEPANNQKLSVAGNWIQYKAVLSSTAFAAGDYSGSSRTPVLEDVTITYLPRVEVLYWREERE